MSSQSTKPLVRGTFCPVFRVCPQRFPCSDPRNAPAPPDPPERPPIEGRPSTPPERPQHPPERPQGRATPPSTPSTPAGAGGRACRGRDTRGFRRRRAYAPIEPACGRYARFGRPLRARAPLAAWLLRSPGKSNCFDRESGARIRDGGESSRLNDLRGQRQKAGLKSCYIDNSNLMGRCRCVAKPRWYTR